MSQSDHESGRWDNLLPLLAFINCLALLLQLARDEVWAPAAHLVYFTFLILLAGSAVFVRLSARYPAAKYVAQVVLLVLWVLLPVILIVAAYVPSGWNLWNRTLLLMSAALLTTGLVRLSPSPLPRSGLLTVFVTITLTLFLTYMIDRGVGLAMGGRDPGGLVFPRNSHVSYETPEFDYTVKINRYGFRGENIDLDTPVGCRVMLLGDSFTYGWGVDYEQTWGVLLQNHLQAAGIDAQVLNLGSPGSNIPDYAAIAEVATPILQPDVILVGVLQGDDMRQMSREASLFPRTVTFGDEIRISPFTEYVTFHYPHIAERTILSRVSAGSVRLNWQQTAAQFIEKYAQHEDWQSRYDNLPELVRAWFEAGEINPHFLDFAIIMPDYWVWALQDPTTLTPYQNDMAGYFRQITQAAPAAKTVIVSVPYGAYTQPEARDDLAEMGFIMPSEIVESTLVDDAIEHAANIAGLPFIKVTEAFRQHETLAFYPVDGHFNAEGNRLFAETIASSVSQYCGNQ